MLGICGSKSGLESNVSDLQYSTTSKTTIAKRSKGASSLLSLSDDSASSLEITTSSSDTSEEGWCLIENTNPKLSGSAPLRRNRNEILTEQQRVKKSASEGIIQKCFNTMPGDFSSGNRTETNESPEDPHIQNGERELEYCGRYYTDSLSVSHLSSVNSPEQKEIWTIHHLSQSSPLSPTSCYSSSPVPLSKSTPVKRNDIVFDATSATRIMSAACPILSPPSERNGDGKASLPTRSSSSSTQAELNVGDSDDISSALMGDVAPITGYENAPDLQICQNTYGNTQQTQESEESDLETSYDDTYAHYSYHSDVKGEHKPTLASVPPAIRKRRAILSYQYGVCISFL